MVVIGAGIIGACTALALVKRGHAVTIIEPAQPGGEQAASYGNGGWLSPSLVVPLSLPGLWRKVPGFLADPAGPLTINWRYLPWLSGWLRRFLRAGATVARVQASALALRPLVAGCHLRHHALATEAGVADLIVRNGQLQVYRSREHFLAEHLPWTLRREAGAVIAEVPELELRKREPDLHERYTFGATLDGYNCISPGAYVGALVDHAIARGARLVRTKAHGFKARDSRALSIETSSGSFAFDEAVICTGAHSRTLAAEAGDRVFLEAERGYHVMFPNLDVMPKGRVLLMDGRMTNTPSKFGLRVTGHVEFSSLNAPPNWRHAEALRDFTLSAYPRMTRAAAKEVRFWMGARPSTPDSLPIIGRASGLRNVVHAFGHGHIGVASGPTTAELVADIVSDVAPSIDPAPYSPRRFMPQQAATGH
ncbi:NAD(P)/FAD-dependent oxidoreductase [Dongia sedimenti]|uniref:FAD-binding oxidoreductase n=1 Tax=Dongia sedimenti TaxID=3064282 RepID=A0ABU0YTK8_9PROT|nr:FAD-binding oxidoreductase [Rhodospirillaceae bacterium R-7]